MNRYSTRTKDIYVTFLFCLPGTIIMQNPEPMVIQQTPMPQYAILPRAPPIQTSQIMLQPHAAQQPQLGI